MERMNRLWRENGTVDIYEVLKEMDSLEKIVDTKIVPDGDSDKPVLHRQHREMARVYKEKLRQAIGTRETPDEKRELVRAEVIAQTILNVYCPEEINFWYGNRSEADGAHHHNEEGKTRIETMVAAAKRLRDGIGSYEKVIHTEDPEELKRRYLIIIADITERDITKHAGGLNMYAEGVGQDYLNFAAAVLGIVHDLNTAQVKKDGGGIQLMGALRSIGILHQKYNERYIGERYQHAGLEIRMATERFMIDLEILRTVLQRYVDYKMGKTPQTSQQHL